MSISISYYNNPKVTSHQLDNTWWPHPRDLDPLTSKSLGRQQGDGARGEVSTCAALCAAFPALKLLTAGWRCCPFDLGSSPFMSHVQSPYCELGALTCSVWCFLQGFKQLYALLGICSSDSRYKFPCVLLKVIVIKCEFEALAIFFTGGRPATFSHSRLEQDKTIQIQPCFLGVTIWQ